jgi:hypothetical protein
LSWVPTSVSSGVCPKRLARAEKRKKKHWLWRSFNPLTPNDL